MTTTTGTVQTVTTTLAANQEIYTCIDIGPTDDDVETFYVNVLPTDTPTLNSYKSKMIEYLVAAATSRAAVKVEHEDYGADITGVSLGAV